MNRCNNPIPEISVSVIGFPGATTQHREHVGKSSLISRFMSASSYSESHLSVLSPSDFDGEVICGSHWIYWGGKNINICGKSCAQLRVVEHCEFVDDHLFNPIAVGVPYIERCLSTELNVPSKKLAYVCKEQLGHEFAFPQTYLDPGILHIDVFICVYDMTLNGQSALQQASFLKQVLSHLSSLKLPAVLATSKHDGEVTQISSELLESVLKDVKKRWIRRHFCLVETSSRFDINVHTAFQCATSLATIGITGKPKASTSHLLRLLRLNDTMKPKISTRGLKESIE